ncbi:MAG: hypothetical protein J6C50_04740 [Rickettsiales bacterium]|nr:hypothetical protein [Rickettsiales bacterium]
MLKKIFVLFLCFWMSCGSVFTATARTVNNYNTAEKTNQEENIEENYNCNQNFNQQEEDGFLSKVSDFAGNLLMQFIGGVAFAIGNAAFNHFVGHQQLQHVHQD